MQVDDFERVYPQGLLCSLYDVPEGYGAIYLITDLTNDKVYVGQTWQTVYARWRGHLSDANKEETGPMLITRAIKKHGKQNFTVGLLGVANTQETLDALEDLWIIVLGSQDTKIGYNIRGGGSNGKWNQTTTQKMSGIMKNKWAEPGYKEKVAKTMASEATKRKILEASERINNSPEIRAQRSRTTKAAWDDPEKRDKMMAARNTPQALANRAKGMTKRIATKRNKVTLKEAA